MMESLDHPGDGQVTEAGSRLVDHEEPVTAPSSARRGWVTSPVQQGLIALAIYLAAWLTTSARPLISHPGQAQLDQASMDPNFYAWCLRWWPYAIGHGLNPLYTHQIGAPVGFALAWVTTIPPLALLATPLTLTAGAVVSFNLLTAIAMPVSGWAAFVLCRRFTHRFWPALIGGFVYGFSAYEMNHDAAGQLNLAFSLLLPIMAYLVLQWWDENIKTRTFVILLGITMAAQFYLFLETFADLTALLAIALLIGFALAGRDARPAVARLSKFIGLAYLVTIVLALPYLAAMLTKKTPQQAHVSGLDLASLVIPRPGRTLGLGWLAHAANGPVQASAAGYVGIPLLAVAILLAVTTWSSKITRFLSCMLIIVVVASLGPSVYLGGHKEFGLPWARLWSLPIVRNAYPSRLMLFGYLLLAVITAVWLAAPSKRRLIRWPLALLIVAAVVLDSIPLIIAPASNLPTFISQGNYRRNLSPHEIVVVVSTTGNAGMLWQVESDFYMRLAGGYVNQAITSRTDLPPQVQALSHYSPQAVQNFEAYVRSARIGAILVDANQEPLWVGIFLRIGLKGERIGGVLVYQLHHCRTCRAAVPPHS
ncbi:MAG TPA: hypothetical protein VGI66_05340 [Streptosporangiaceae bacterium]